MYGRHVEIVVNVLGENYVLRVFVLGVPTDSDEAMRFRAMESLARFASDQVASKKEAE